MKTISQVHINQTWQRVANLPPEKAAGFFERLSRQQPALMVYLTAMENPDQPPGPDNPRAGALLFIGIAVVEIMLTATRQPLREVTIEEVEAAEARNETLLQKLDEGPEMGFMEAVQGLMHSYNQMPLLGSVITALMEDYQDEPDLADENVGLGLIHLKTVIDCLDEISN